MANRLNSKRVCVMIVEQDLTFGIKLADWLAAHRYQAVLIRSAAAAIDECRNINPQAVFVGLVQADPATGIGLSNLLSVIETIDPRLPVIAMEDQAGQDPPQVVIGRQIRRLLVKPFEFTQVNHVLRSELSTATASPASLIAPSDTRDRWAVERPPHGRAVKTVAGMICHHCQGFMHPVDPLDPFDALTDDGQGRVRAWRCVACGEIIDEVIMQNRIRLRNQHSVKRQKRPRQPVFKTSNW